MLQLQDLQVSQSQTEKDFSFKGMDNQGKQELLREISQTSEVSRYNVQDGLTGNGFHCG